MIIRSWHYLLGHCSLTKQEFENCRFGHSITTSEFVDDPQKWIISEKGKPADFWVLVLDTFEFTIFY